MPRWEFHLSVNETGMLARWTWMQRLDAGDTISSKIKFATYRECMTDALLHGYRAGEAPPYSEPMLSGIARPA